MTLALPVLLALPPAHGHAATVVVASCGMVVQGRAVLEADLDCSSHPGHALVLDGRLELNGFTLTGNSTDPSGYSTVDCTGKCRITIKGPGTIAGGVTAVSGGKVRVSNEVVVRDAAEWGVSGTSVQLTVCYVTNNGLALAVGPTGGGGVVGGKISVSRSTIENNGSFGVNALVRARLNRSKATDNGLVDVRSYERPRLHDTTCLVSRRGDLTETWGVCLGE